MTEKYVSEQELNSKAVAPRVTLEAIEANIRDERYFSPFDGVVGERFVRNKEELLDSLDNIPAPLREQMKLTTYCLLTLANGYTITGTAACVSPENYDENIGRRVARGDAIRQIWPLMGYALRTQLADAKNISSQDAGLGEALTRMTAVSLGTPEAFRQQDADIILANFRSMDRSEEGGITRVDPRASNISDKKLAELCHELNRVWCEQNGDHSQARWAAAPEWQRESVINGVQYHRANPQVGPEESHANWLLQKEKDGWEYGVEKDADAKLHPCMVPYSELPEFQQFKDKLFTTIIHAADERW